MVHITRPRQCRASAHDRRAQADGNSIKMSPVRHEAPRDVPAGQEASYNKVLQKMLCVTQSLLVRTSDPFLKGLNMDSQVHETKGAPGKSENWKSLPHIPK